MELCGTKHDLNKKWYHKQKAWKMLKIHSLIGLLLCKIKKIDELFNTNINI